MGNFKGDYNYPIRLIGAIRAYQGNKVASNNWMNKMYDRIHELALDEGAVHVTLTSEDKELNKLLERVQGNIDVHEIEFPWNDVPPVPKCTGSLNQYTGLITHDTECQLDIHKGVPVHAS